MDRCDFLPVSAEEMHERGWWWYDALVVGGDAYVDHPSFGTAVISRVLEAEGLRVAVLAQPDWHDAEAFRAMGRPRLGVFIGAGNLDSMVAHYTAAKRRRSEDFYSPGKRTGCRPDRAAIVYCNRAREAFGPDVPIILGSLEAALRTMTTGTIPCAAPSSLTPRPTCWSTAWARPRRSRSPTGSRKSSPCTR